MVKGLLKFSHVTSEGLNIWGNGQIKVHGALSLSCSLHRFEVFEKAEPLRCL